MIEWLITLPLWILLFFAVPEIQKSFAAREQNNWERLPFLQWTAKTQPLNAPKRTSFP
jgi:hypothetical protein